jgi:PAS domain S-box-containing protein
MPAPHAETAEWEQAFWGVFERSTNPIVLLDSERYVVDVNAALCGLMGRPREAFVGQRADRFVARHELENIDSEWRAFWASDIWENERVLIGAEGERIRVEFAARTSDIDGRKVAVLVFIRIELDEETAPAVALGDLTPREREIVSLVALGNTSAQIAVQLVISIETVRTHVRNAMAKTGARTRAQLVAMALADHHLAAAA